MPGNLKREDLRIVKTYKVLSEAIFTLLEYRNFCQITVNDLCEQALISRTTFYTHFNDKYDLLKYCLEKLEIKIDENEETTIRVEKVLNYFICEKYKIVKNLLENANGETLEIISNFIKDTLFLAIKGEDSKQQEQDTAQSVLSIFCAGGISRLILWKTPRNNEEDLKRMNHDLALMLVHLLKWDA